MTNHPTTRGSLAVPLIALALACGPASEQSSAKLDTQGGQVALTSGLTLSVPTGALSQAVSVTVRETRHGDEREIELEPHGLVLAIPATLSVSDDGGTGELEHESGEHLAGEHHGGRLEAQVSRFERLRMRSRHGGDGGVEDRDGGEAGDDHGGHGEGEHADGGEAGDDHGAHDGGEAGDDSGGLGGADAGADGHGGGSGGGADADGGSGHGGH